MFRNQSPKIPEDVGLLYRPVGRSHVFSAPDLPGFQIGHPDLQLALEGICPALSSHLSATHGVPLRYELAGDYMLFLARIGHFPTFVIAFKYPREGTLLNLAATR
jgi:hypothetical protein